MALSRSCPVILISLFITAGVTAEVVDDDCPRHRKPWHLLSDGDRMRFVNGFQQLRRNGVLSAFTETHHLEGVAFEDIHKTSEFFFWHSYFVWELESQFRNLGGDYACFSMPFWDITNDADFLSSSTDPDASTIPILLGVLGGNGNADHNHCVEDEPWTVDQYSTEYLCVPPEVPPDCCLKRDVRSEATLPTTTEWTDTMRYARFRDFQDAVSDFHGKVHKLFAADSQSHMFSNNAAEDPLFVLLHSFLDYLRSLRQNCWHFDFEADAVQTLQDHVPFAFDSYDVEGYTFKPQLDTPLRFELICNLKDARCGREEVTIRKMYDIGSWGISYEPGPFWNDNDGLQALCGELNPQWFYGEDLSVALSAQREEVVISEGDTAARQQHLRDVFNWWLLMAAVIALNVSLVWLLVRKYVMTWKSTNRNARKLVHDEQEAANLVIGESLIRYGTV